MIRNALRLTVQASFARAKVVEATNQSSLESALAQQPHLDLILLDLCIPGARGFSSLLQLRASRPDVPIVVISGHDQPENILKARRFGALGFISKTAPMDDMQSTLRQALAGQTCFPQVAAATDPADQHIALRLRELTPQQIRVLMGLADGLQNKQIAQELGLAENTVKVHVSAILRKLDLHSRTQAALIAQSLDEAFIEAGPLD